MSAIRVDRDGLITRVALARPEVRNAFDATLIAELRSTFEALAREPADALRAVVLSGDGPAFCAGADVAWMRSAVGLSVEDNERDAAAMQAMFTAIDACPVPVVARVHGVALGGGMGLCAVADIVVASADTTFGFTEVRLGILPAVISPFVIPKIGESAARALFVTGERFDAERALRIGLVHEVAADVGALDARVEQLTADLLRAGPTAARAAKAMIRELRTLPPEEARAHVVRTIARQRTSAEGQEGLAAFLEKRQPEWAPDD
jgi:methylglutaconyl-CoA hydratase